MGKNKMILLLILVFSLGCAGCTEKNPAAEQGELVKMRDCRSNSAVFLAVKV